MKKSFFTTSKYIFLIFCMMSFVQLLAIGPFPEENSSWDENELKRQRQAGLQLQNDLKTAIKEGESSFVAPKGIYRFEKSEGEKKAYFNFVNVKNFEFDANGSDFYFDKNDAAISIRKCKNLKIKNFSLDYEPLPFKQGKIVDIDYDKNILTFRPEKGYEKNITSFATGRGFLFSPEDRILKAKQSGFNVEKISEKENGDIIAKVNGFYGYSAKKIGIKKGDLLVILTRTARLIRTEGSENVAFENIDVFSAPFCVFVENTGKGGHSYTNCRIIKRPGTNRLIAANADGFHSNSLAKGPIIENCVIDTIGDDFVNLHGKYYRIYEKISPREFIVEKFPIDSNDDIKLSFLENESWKALGEIKVEKYENTTYTFTSEEKIKEVNWRSNRNIKIGQKLRVYKITLDKDLDLKTTAIFSCNNFVSGGGVIRNCKFSYSLARGIRLQSINTLIENNIITRTTTGPILTTGGQPNYWGESVTAYNLICRNNTFSEGHLGYTSATAPMPTTIQFIAPGPANTAQMIDNVVFTNNRILRSGGAAISIKNAKNIQIKDNEIGEFNLLNNPEVKKLDKPIVVVDSKDITIDN